MAQVFLLLLFVGGAYLQYLHEQCVFLQKKIDGPVYVELEGRRKQYRTSLLVIFFCIGITAAVICQQSFWQMLIALVASAVPYWILFDGLYATRVKKRSFWHVGTTSRLDRFIRTEKRSRQFKLALAAAAIAGFLVNLLVL